jgi:hypothetical protein
MTQNRGSTPGDARASRTGRRVATIALLTTALFGCAAPSPSVPPAPRTAPEQAALEQARGIAARVPPSLLAVLSAELERGGPTAAIGVCQVRAPAMARAASEQTGWQVRRASLGPRAPHGQPDAWERAVLQRFDAEVAAGANPATLEAAEVVDEQGQRVYRYAKALPTQALCVQCHGKADRLAPGVAELLRERYPADRGTGYEIGQVRGGLFLKKPL